LQNSKTKIVSRKRIENLYFEGGKGQDFG